MELRGYYQKFIKNYGAIATTLTKLLKNEGFKWSKEAEEAFQQLKTAMEQEPTLILPDFAKKFVVEADTFWTWIRSRTYARKPAHCLLQ